jgi:hypothetical protein
MSEDPIDIDFVTAPVTTGLVEAEVLDPRLDEKELVLLARELVRGIADPQDCYRHAQITSAQFDHFVLTNRFFKRAYQMYLVEWNDGSNTALRLKYQSQAGLEAALPTLAARMLDNKEPLSSTVQLGTLFAKIAEVGNEKAPQTVPGEKFTITINLGADGKGANNIETYQETIGNGPTLKQIEGIAEVQPLSKG